MSDITFADLISIARTHDAYWEEVLEERQNQIDAEISALQSQIELEIKSYISRCSENGTEVNYWAIFEIISRIMAPYTTGVGGGGGNSI